MKKDTKIVLAVLVAGGGLLLTRYFIRQYRLLRNVCVSNTNLNWAQELAQAAFDAASGDGFSYSTLDADFQLELTNSSDIPVTIKDINLSVFLEGQKIGSIIDQQPTTLDRNSSQTLFLRLDIDENIIQGAVETTALQTGLEFLVSIFSSQVDIPTTRIEIQGIINVKASFYESFKIRYRQVTTPDGIIEESSGNCEPLN